MQAKRVLYKILCYKQGYFDLQIYSVMYWSFMWIQIAMWLIMWWKPVPIVVILSKMFFAGLSLLYAKYIFCNAQLILILIYGSWSMYSGRCLFVCSPGVSPLWWQVTSPYFFVCCICFSININSSKVASYINKYM